MFTGLVESEGIITRIERVAGGARLEVYAPEFGRDMSIGDSIAVDGACLTVIKFIRGAFIADVSEETLSKTTLGGMRQGGKVNLERVASAEIPTRAGRVHAVLGPSRWGTELLWLARLTKPLEQLGNRPSAGGDEKTEVTNRRDVGKIAQENETAVALNHSDR